MSVTAYVGRELELFAQARNWKRYFAALLAPHIRGRVLEVGAGIGETTRVLWVPSVESWTCLEPDAQLAERLRGLRLGADQARAPHVVCGTIADLEPGSAFDSILYIDVLEHIEDDRAELTRAASLLARGGTLTVLSPAYQCLFSEFDRALGHFRRYTRRSLSEAFPAHLQRETIFYADSVGALLSAGNRVLLRQQLPTARQIRTWDRIVIPISRIVDRATHRSIGRSVIAVYRQGNAPSR